MTDKSENIGRFWLELRRRRVVRVIAVYLAVALAILELVYLISTPLDFPSWVLFGLMILLALGFISAFILSWTYDRTPKGLEKTKPLDEEVYKEPEKLPGLGEWKATMFVSLAVIAVLVVFHLVIVNKRTQAPVKTEKSQGVATIDGEPVYLIVEEMPTFKLKGYRDFRDFIKQELRYPEASRSEGISGRVFVQFVVRRDGTVDDVTVVRGINEELDQEAIRVVQSSPKWNPGIHNGKPVNVSYSFPVVFTLE